MGDIVRQRKLEELAKRVITRLPALNEQIVVERKGGVKHLLTVTSTDSDTLGLKYTNVTSPAFDSVVTVRAEGDKRAVEYTIVFIEVMGVYIPISLITEDGCVEAPLVRTTSNSSHALE